MAAPTVKISVEKLLEQEVEEISRAGEEKYIRPLTISEELKELAQKIDFDEKGDKATTADDSDNEDDISEGDNAKDKIQGKKGGSWPWESLHNKLRTTLQEVCVLLDVLQTVKQRKYIVLDPVTQKEEPPKPTVQMLGKRKSLKRAADIIHQGARRMESVKGNEFSIPSTSHVKDYFHELMKLRQRWRVKKSGNHIMGDLSYRTAGSKFWHQGVFEVSKAEWENEKEAIESSEEALSVKLGSDLEGCTRTLFKIKMGGRSEISEKHTAQLPTVVANGNTSTISWQKQLECSQHNLYCKELFAQLAREAYSCPSYYSTELSRDEVEVKLPSGDSISIVNNKDESNENGHDAASGSEIGQYLQYRAELLLRNEHRSVLGKASVQPPSITKSETEHAYGLCGFFTKSRRTPDQSTLFEKLVGEAQHAILRKMTADTIDRLTAVYQDPILICHWGMISAPTRSSLTVTLLSRKCGFCYRSFFHIQVGTGEYRIVTNSGLAVDVSAHKDRLQDFIESMISQHVLEVAQCRLEHFGWAVRQLNKITLLHLSSDTDHEEMVPGILAESPAGVRVRVLIESASKCRITLQRSQPSKEYESLRTLLGEEWLANVQTREEVDFDTIHGSTFLDKFDSFLALVGSCT